jgi:NADH:ubiquinone oxidoreductase subunit E
MAAEYRRGKKVKISRGRPVDLQALEEIRALLGEEPRRRDLLIEHLHKLQGTYGYISARHLVALAYEMRLSYAEVFEVATFYHHFDVVKEGEVPPPELTVRVCQSLSCALAGGQKLLETLRHELGEGRSGLARPVCRALSTCPSSGGRAKSHR